MRYRSRSPTLKCEDGATFTTTGFYFCVDKYVSHGVILTTTINSAFVSLHFYVIKAVDIET